MASKTVEGLAQMCPTCGGPLTIVRKVPPLDGLDTPSSRSTQAFDPLSRM